MASAEQKREVSLTKWILRGASLNITHQRRVRSADDGDAQRLACPRDFDVGDLALQHRQPGYACKRRKFGVR